MMVEVISAKIIPLMYHNFRRVFPCGICLLLFVVVWLILHVFSSCLQTLLPLILCLTAKCIICFKCHKNETTYLSIVIFRIVTNAVSYVRNKFRRHFYF